ncbi:hybrid sensor histidine kinase/response regulator [Pedobacter montanisoli]|uniref:histidine kinase n=1 Tax=Pedobacter montanisoli TaxID=2923277 RepID=A0ABS9ZVF7_9SPHI|nr:response regulator [Pedobacter montanisoli]MCJ0742238.1 response regulator [Pedobacter montanisoli]
MIKLSFKQQIFTGFAVSLIFVLVSAMMSYFSITSLTESAALVEHTQSVIKKAEEVEVEIINAEAGLRGFVITLKDEYKQPYNQSIDKIIPSIEELKKIIGEENSNAELVDSLQHYAALKVYDLKQVMAKANTLGDDAAKKQIATDKGRIYKEQFLKFNAQLIRYQYNLLAQKKIVNEQRAHRTILIVTISSFIIFGLILFLFSYIKRTFDQQKETEKLIRNTNDELALLSAKNEHNNWMLLGETKLNEVMHGEQSMDELTTRIVTQICTYLSLPVGLFFLVNKKEQTLKSKGGYACKEKPGFFEVKFGETLVGQAAFEKKIKILDNVPNDYIKIETALGNTLPAQIVCIPVLFENETIAIIELGFRSKITEEQIAYLEAVSPNIGIAVNAVMAKAKLQALFEQTQQQAEELASQQEELRVTNEDLIHKTEELQASEEELRVQQEELQQANAELEEKAQLLEEKNVSLNQAKEAISLKAEELELSSKYKSEFLANMSHELRTPLNSILILAKILKENKPLNLNEEQIKYAGVIHNAGTDLLSLINDILDLSKIESGNVDLVVERVALEAIKEQTDALFTEVANQKNINYQFKLADDLPEFIQTDETRLTQIIKNLLSNAFKFTSDSGSVTVNAGIAGKDQKFYHKNLNNEASAGILYFSIKDTGIGIAADKQQIIFEAFQQEDGSTSRKYGGTGLGLSISRELANLLGGEIQLESQAGLGSTFTLFIPLHTETAKQEIKQENESTDIPVELPAKPVAAEESETDKKHTRLLIVEDDENFAEILKNYAIEKGFEPVLAYSGDKGLELAQTLKPDAIILDIMLPVMDGWTILKKLKADPDTQHIPVHMMSAGDEKVKQAQKEGAIGFLKKPIEKEQLDKAFRLLSEHNEYQFNNVLVIEDQVLQSNELSAQLIEKGAKVAQAYTGAEARQILEHNHFDCIVLDLKLPDVSGFDLLDEIKLNPKWASTPVIINTAMELDKEQMAHIMRHTQAMVLKNNKSNDRLLDEVNLFVNKIKKEEPQKKNYSDGKTQKVKNASVTIEKALENKNILITDDDMRNIFALSSALQSYNINVIIATNGREALEKLEEHPEIDLVLMDIMMPEMDGYEAMKAIRQQTKLAKLPVIALTAKAMKNDKEKCIEAGANDYIAKPIDTDKLLSMLRVWLS